MFRPLELFVGLRYTRAKRRNHFISFISLISMLGLALGVAVLITVLSVMNGFEKEVRSRILGATAHATISGLDGRLSDWTALRNELKGRAGIIASAPYIHSEAMLSRGSHVTGALVRGVIPSLESQVSVIAAKMIAGHLGDLREGRFGIILGIELARQLGVGIGDRITMVTPQANVTPAGVLPRLKRFVVVGIFEVGMYEYDSALALTNLSDAATLLRYGSSVSGLRLKLNDLFDAPLISRQLEQFLGPGYYVTDWTRQHVNYFRAVHTEKRVMFIILLLIVSVAAFNIVSTLVMLVTDKESDIAILQTMGASPRSIMAIFLVQGSLIGVLGVLLGTVGGITLALNVETIVPAIEQFFNVHFFPADVYYISDIPSDMHWSDVVSIAVISLILSVISTLYPSWRAARVRPAEALRYE